MALLAATATRGQLTGDDAVVWQKRLGRFPDRGAALALDPAGNVFAAGTLIVQRHLRQLVVKLRPDGALAWRRSARGRAFALAADRDGNAIVAGQSGDPRTGWDFAVLKRGARTGRLMWRRAFDGTAQTVHDRTFVGSLDTAFAVAVDPSGDVVAAGQLENDRTSYDLVVVKLAASDGDVRWQRIVTGAESSVSFDGARAVAVDAAGDVIVAGTLSSAFLVSDLVVMKLAGTDGHELWRRNLRGFGPEYNAANAITLNRAGDIVVAGDLGNPLGFADFAVVLVAGSDGAERWRHVTSSSALFRPVGQATAIALDDADDVIAGGTTGHTGEVNANFTVVKLRGATGALAWRTDLAGPGDFGGGVNAVAVDTAGIVVAAGHTEAGTGAGVYGSDFTAAWFAPDSGVELARYVIDRTGPILAADAVAATDDGSVLVAGEAGRLTVLELASPGRSVRTGR